MAKTYDGRIDEIPSNLTKAQIENAYKNISKNGWETKAILVHPSNSKIYVFSQKVLSR